MKKSRGVVIELLFLLQLDLKEKEQVALSSTPLAGGFSFPAFFLC